MRHIGRMRVFCVEKENRMADIKKKTQVTSPTEDKMAGMVPADVRTQRSYTAERAHRIAAKVKDIPSSAKKVARR